MEKQTGSDQNDRLLLPDDVSIFVYNGQCKGMPLDAFKVNEAFGFAGILNLMVGVAAVAVLEDKSILPVNVAVPLATTDEVDIKESSTIVLEEQLFECFRMILSVLRSFIVTIGNEEAETAEKHYVECRKSQQKVLKDLHRWLRLARLVALSRDEGQISKASWDAMLALESQQLARSTSNESTST
ncbi:hypothetical protein BBI17_008889 [Phytophthora kernoviae]|uniref:Uncharacterized protein n=2 Tax=Phytophthora kernoviae TaxID=325452 RepID=A0A421FLB9_9STRA|nr:hypothetical protein G195_010355 [Phytophthora kernoviae 00238/432]KAG2510971.1 hypothetical protein JM18_008742 [Phytophthora kernoviae]RLN46721.1 hypothetical protein BBI17_008889 [Phytophthora kernoviae]